LPQAAPADGISQSVADEKREKSTPPGDFVSDDHRTQTANFLDELRKRLKHKRSEAEPKLGPPKRPG
jgi:hypothetical protein